jgi:hypothetical protein
MYVRYLIVTSSYSADVPNLSSMCRHPVRPILKERANDRRMGVVLRFFNAASNCLAALDCFCPVPSACLRHLPVLPLPSPPHTFHRIHPSSPPTNRSLPSSQPITTGSPSCLASPPAPPRSAPPWPSWNRSVPPEPPQLLFPSLHLHLPHRCPLRLHPHRCRAQPQEQVGVRRRRPARWHPVHLRVRPGADAAAAVGRLLSTLAAPECRVQHRRIRGKEDVSLGPLSLLRICGDPQPSCTGQHFDPVFSFLLAESRSLLRESLDLSSLHNSSRRSLFLYVLFAVRPDYSPGIAS